MYADAGEVDTCADFDPSPSYLPTGRSTVQVLPHVMIAPSTREHPTLFRPCFELKRMPVGSPRSIFGPLSPWAPGCYRNYLNEPCFPRALWTTLISCDIEPHERPDDHTHFIRTVSLTGHPPTVGYDSVNGHVRKSLFLSQTPGEAAHPLPIHTGFDIGRRTRYSIVSLFSVDLSPSVTSARLAVHPKAFLTASLLVNLSVNPSTPPPPTPYLLSPSQPGCDAAHSHRHGDAVSIVTMSMPFCQALNGQPDELCVVWQMRVPDLESHSSHLSHAYFPAPSACSTTCTTAVAVKDQCRPISTTSKVPSACPRRMGNDNARIGERGKFP